MKYYWVYILTFLVNISMIGQDQQSSTDLNNSAMHTAIAIGTLSTNNYSTKALTYENVKGSPYLNVKPISGYLLLLDGEKTESALLQYNIYTNEFLYIDDKGTQHLLEMKKCIDLYMSGAEENYHFKRADPTKPDAFYDMLYEDQDLKIYNVMEVKFFEGRDQGITKIDPRFTKYDNLFYKKTGELPEKVKVKKKDILALFPKQKSEQLKQLAKEKKLKLKKIKEFKALFSSLSS